MQKIFIQILVIGVFVSGFSGCTIFKKDDYTKVHKPISHKKPYNPKKNRYSKRVKVTKMRR